MLSHKQNTGSPSYKSTLEQKAVASECLLPSPQIALEIRRSEGGEGRGWDGGSVLLFWLSGKYVLQ